MSFETGQQRISDKRYHLPTGEIKNHNVMIDGQFFFYQPIFDNIQKISTGQRNDCTTCCLLDYDYLLKYYKMIAIDLSKQQVLYADSKAI